MATARAITTHQGDRRWADPMKSVGTNARTMAASAETNDAYGPVKMEPLQLDATAATRKAAADAGPNCSVGARAASAEEGPVEVMGDLVDKSKRWVTIGSSFPVGGDTAFLDFTSTASTKYGIATNISGDWKAGGSKSATAGWGFTWAESKANRAYRTQVEYGKFRYTAGGCGGTRTYHKWEPRKETGGASSVEAKVPNWTNCAPVPAGKWHRTRQDGKDYHLGGGAKLKGLIGIDLSSERAYASVQPTT
ncbi:hypothetical protein [Streptomyces sp. CC219B]|uniref:hypothetical protein n=1 Tax=Streptomyces sp. CC219B TaxID=3044574 RepID=UPI0024A97C4F|nr:hypothetical protein [Streptomyces sp. CC219B]